MPDFGSIVKGGWHPEKKGTTFKGQMKGLVGRGDKDKDEERANHVSRPIASLRDPASFAPPPKRTADQPLPPPISRTSTASSAAAGPPSYNDSNRYATQQQQQYGAVAEEEDDTPAPPKPYRVDTTGLSTSHLPPPPKMKNMGIAPPPSLPPRLPPRTPSASTTPIQSPAPTGGSSNAASGGGGYLNQGAMNRLGAAGVSVPAFGIGRSSSPAAPAPAPAMAAAPSPTPAPAASHMSELQNRFSKLSKPSFGAPSPAGVPTDSYGATSPPPAEGTTMAQKQAALRTASNFHKDPSSVSMADARSAAGTLNNFRQRHGDQVASGVRTAGALNQKYGIADRVGGYAGQVGAQQEGVTQRQGQGQAETTSTVSSPSSSAAVLPPPGLAGKKKPPPPPPKKKPALAGVPQQQQSPSADDGGPPPPVPLSTRPQW
ncbi:hypothetical protein VD0002_g6247 [Verticillium dahliae]|nr:hypothetical protein VD0002_g6247 [Verticillium dahliae]